MALPLPERPPSSLEVFDDALDMLRSDRARGFNIDVETDSMVFEDQRAERAARLEFIQSVTTYLKEAIPASQLYPDLKPILVELLMFGIRGFKAGRQLEQVFEQAADELNETPAQPRPDPKAEEVKAKTAARREELAIDREDKAIRRQEEFRDQVIRRDADLLHEQRRLDIAAANKPPPAPPPEVDPTAPTEREKFEFQRQEADRNYRLKLASQNKQIMADAESELTGGQATTKSPLAEMSNAIAVLATAIVEGNRTLAEQIAAGQAQIAEGQAQLAAVMSAPRSVDLRRDKTGRATGATSTIAVQ